MKPIYCAAAFVTLSIAAPASAAPGDMNIATFLAKADALKAKGLTALFSSDISVLKSEASAAIQSYKARQLQDKASGHPSSCPPQSATLDSDHLLAHLRSYSPAARQNTNMRTAISDMFVKRFPCPK